MDVELSKADPDDPDVERLVALLLVDIAVRYQSDEPEPPLGPSAGFLVARRDGVAVGCVAVQDLGPGIGELKRMYVAEHERGRGIGRLLLGGADELARERGYTRLRLETGDMQPEAVALYASGGWHRIEPYGYWKAEPGVICFEKQLAG